jgi:two-component system chemotaxis response regulator CheY
MTVHATDPGRPLTILIVDDSAMMRALIRRVAGLVDVPVGRIFEARDGREALAILEAEPVDALFTDINMPVMTGPELLRAIADGVRWSRLIRVIVTTDGSSARRLEVAGLRVDHYIRKPFTPEMMRDVLDDVHARCA